MASHDDLVLIINQLLKGLDKMGDSLSVVKAIGEEVNLIKEDVNLIKSRVEKIESRVEKIEEKISRELPTKSELLTIRDVLDTKLKPLNHISDMNERLLKMEGSISHLRNIEEKTPLKSDVNPVVDIVDCIEKSLSVREEYDSRLTALDIPSPRVSPGAVEPIMTFHPLIKGQRVQLTTNTMYATRLGPLQHAGLAGVISSVHIREDEVFNFRIQETIDNFNIAGIAFGVICDENLDVEKVPNIYRNLKGTWAINSRETALPGKSHIWKDCSVLITDGYSLDTRNLSVGTVLGIKLCGNGDLHFFKNGVDKGVAFRNVPRNVHAFVDVINYVTKISTF